MISLTVKASKTYPIIVTRGWNNFPATEIKGKRVCIVTDGNVASLYLKKVELLFQDALRTVCYVMEPGESSKSPENYLNILNFLAEKNFTRKDVMVALGGGVVGDLTGFVASTYMRGIEYYQIPTSLLAMIDSSVGGKTAIDLPIGKNLVGTFYQPSGVYINLDVLSSLPEEEYKNGMGELVKYAFLSDTIQKRELENPISEQLIVKCLEIKRNIVEADEEEGNARKLLNFGHTVGHAIETLSSYSIPHGICVAKGISVVIDLSAKVYRLSEKVVKEMQDLLSEIGVDLSVPYAKKEIVRTIMHDKKANGSGVDMVLAQGVGNCQVYPLTFAQIEELL